MLSQRTSRRCVAALLLVLAAGALPASAQSGAVPLVVPTPAGRDASSTSAPFALLLTEVWLHRRSSTSAIPPRNSNADLRHSASGASVDVFTATRALSRGELTTSLNQLERDNAGSEGYLVLYEPGVRRDAAHRLLLTREVAVILGSSGSATEILRGRRARPVNGVSGAYVVEAADPLDSIALSAELRRQPSVQDAYPLLKRSGLAR